MKVVLFLVFAVVSFGFSFHRPIQRRNVALNMLFNFGKGGGGGGGASKGDSCLPDVATFSRPKKTLILFEYEASAPSKVVRQACQLLDLVVEHRPCPGGRYGFSDILQTKSQGSRTTPYLIDPGNTVGGLGQAKNSQAIVEYLFTYYGPGVDAVPSNLKGKGLTNPSSQKPLKNFNEDSIYLKPMQFFGWENNNDCKAVREVFSGLCLPFVNVNVANGSKNRPLLEKKMKGAFKIPYMEDPNTKTTHVGKKDIIDHLKANYQQGKQLPRRD